MNTVQNGKGDRPRNNWSPDWRAKYDAIDWHRQPIQQESNAQNNAATMEFNGMRQQFVDIRGSNEPATKTEPNSDSISPRSLTLRQEGGTPHSVRSGSQPS